MKTKYPNWWDLWKSVTHVTRRGQRWKLRWIFCWKPSLYMTNAVSRIFYLVPNTFWKNVHRFWSKKDGILGSICSFEDRIACTSAQTYFFEQQKILDLVFWYNYLRFTAILNRCTHVRSRAVTKILDNVATFSWILAQNSEWTDAGAGHAKKCRSNLRFFLRSESWCCRF